MSKSNPTASPDAPNFEVVGNIIYRYERMDISEAFGALSQVKNPTCVFRDADFLPWLKGNLYYVHPGGAEPFRSTFGNKYQQCGRITAEDPRKVPEGLPELPEPWLAYVGNGPSLPICRNLLPDFPYWIKWTDEDHWESGVDGSHVDHCHAVDVRTAFAREHFPEYVQALGYPMEASDPFEEWFREETNLAGKHMSLARFAFDAGRGYERGLK